MKFSEYFIINMANIEKLLYIKKSRNEKKENGKNKLILLF